MFEVDFLQVGDGERSGDAIALRYTDPGDGQTRRVIIDAGFQDDGPDLVSHFDAYYGTRSVDLALVTHPDGDHIGGMGTVLREMDVAVLGIHRPALHGYGQLEASKAVEELATIARHQGTSVVEPFAQHHLNHVLLIAGPTEEYYEELLAEQAAIEAAGKAVRKSYGLADALARLGQRAVAALPREIPFDDAGGTNPRNNSSIIVDLALPSKRFLFTADAGVPALNNAMDTLDMLGRNDLPPGFIQMPHHGSRHNMDTDTLDRILGAAGQAPCRTAYVSVTKHAPKHPSPRVVNAFMRRGCNWYSTEEASLWHHGDGAPPRDGWVSATPLGPRDESAED